MNAYELDLQKAREIEPHYTWLNESKVDKAERLVTVVPDKCESFFLLTDSAMFGFDYPISSYKALPQTIPANLNNTPHPYSNVMY